MGNLQVRFLEGWAPAMAPGHSTVMSIAKWYLRSTSACAVIKEPVSALPGSAFRGTVETEDYLEGSLVWRERKRRKKVNPLFL